MPTQAMYYLDDQHSMILMLQEIIRSEENKLLESSKKKCKSRQILAGSMDTPKVTPSNLQRTHTQALLMKKYKNIEDLYNDKSSSDRSSEL